MKKIACIAIALAMTFCSVKQSYAAVNQPVGTVVVCTITVSPSSIALSTGDNAQSVTGNGSASFQVTASQQEPVAESELTPLSLNFSGSDPAYGQFNFSFDASRRPQPSIVRSNQPGIDYPATSNIYANVTGTVSSLPGTYTNTNELHLTKSDLMSFAPHVNQVYTVAEDCIFTSSVDGAPSFTIPAGSLVTLD